MDPMTDAVFASLIAGITIEEVNKLFSVTDKEIDVIYQTVLRIQENLKRFIGPDIYRDSEVFSLPKSELEEYSDSLAQSKINKYSPIGAGGPLAYRYNEYIEGKEAGKDYYNEHEAEFEERTIPDILKDVVKSRDNDVSDAYFEGYKEGIREEKERNTARGEQRDKTFLETLGEVAKAYNESQIHPYYPGKKDETEGREESSGSDYTQEMLQTHKELTNKLSSKDYLGAMASLTSIIDLVNEVTKNSRPDSGLAEVTAALGQLAEIGGRVLPALAVLNGKSPAAVAQEMGGAGVASKTAEPEGRSVTEGDVIAIALAVAEKITGEAAQDAAGPGGVPGEAAGRGQRDEEGRTLSDADIAAVRTAVSNSLSRAGESGAGPKGGSPELTQTVSANQEQIIQLLTALQGGEDQIFLYQQLAYSDLVAIRNQLKEMGCDPISNMYDHRNMKI
jgi:hypothetical protein